MTIFSSLMGNDAFPNGINYWHDGFTQNDSTNRMSMGRDRIELRRRSGGSPKKKGICDLQPYFFFAAGFFAAGFFASGFFAAVFFFSAISNTPPTGEG
jgi:hypothetical protein